MNIEFKEESNLGRGSFIAVLRNKLRVGRIEKNRRGEYGYLKEGNELNPEFVSRDLDAVKRDVIAHLK